MNITAKTSANKGALKYQEGTLHENFGLKELLKDQPLQLPTDPGFRRNLTLAMQNSGVASTRVWEATTEMRKLTAEQGWRLHVQRDHVPFRKDCDYCVMMMGTGKQHRRTKRVWMLVGR